MYYSEEKEARGWRVPRTVSAINNLVLLYIEYNAVVNILRQWTSAEFTAKRNLHFIIGTVFRHLLYWYITPCKHTMQCLVCTPSANSVLICTKQQQERRPSSCLLQFASADFNCIELPATGTWAEDWGSLHEGRSLVQLPNWQSG